MSDKLRIGFIPLVDATALIVAVDKGFCRSGRAERRTGTRSVLVECPRQAQHRFVRRRASVVAGGNCLESGARSRQGSDRGAFHSGRERQCHHGVAHSLCRHCRCGRRRSARSEGVGTGARASCRERKEKRARSAHFRHDVSVLPSQLSSAFLDGGGRRRSRRRCAPRGAAAALHGGKPCERSRRRFLRRRAVEFGRGRSRHRPHSALRLRDFGARLGESAGGARAVGGGQSRGVFGLVRAHQR